MQVLVVATTDRCVAASALQSERIPFGLVIPHDDYAYGDKLTQYWHRGKDFINMEHDVVPWPGAIEDLWDCAALWCIHQYPIGHSGKLQSGLGLVKFSQELIGLHPDACFGWDETPWNQLDAQVYGALEIDRKIPPHIHFPPVAHLTDFKAFKVAKEIDEAWVMPDDSLMPPTIKPPPADPKLISMVTRDRGSHHPENYGFTAEKREWFND